MRILDAKSTLKNRVLAALGRIFCLLLLLFIFAPARVLAVPPAVHDDYFDEILEDSDDSDNVLDVLANDEPLPGTPFTIAGVTQGLYGSVQVISGNTLITYQPDPDYAGDDQFFYFVEGPIGQILAATVYITVQGINDPPVAEDDNAATNEDQSVTIDVLNNDHDIDGNLNPASVQRISGPSQGLVTVNGSNGRITYSPNADYNGQDSFTYRVCDDGSPPPPRCDQANVIIIVRPVSDPPIADAGPDQSVPTLSTVTLDGSGSYDPDGEVELSYEWQQQGGTPVILSDPTAQSPTFTAPDDPDLLTFSLIVYDDGGKPSTNTDNTTRVTVTNQTPVANAGVDQRVQTEAIVTLNGSASYDPDYDTLTFEWVQTAGSPVTLSSTTAESPTFTAPASAASLTFALRVEDAYGARSAPDEVKVDVYETPISYLYLPSVASKHAILPDLVIKTLAATKNNVQVVIENQGNAAVTHGFYVDAYINPQRPPAGANEGWDSPGVSSGRGLVWAIEIAQTPIPSQGMIAPLQPGASLTLNANDAFYQPQYSSMTWPLAAGTPIYAQVDSFPDTAPHNGLVLETHELLGQPYNNIAGPVISTNASSSTIAPVSYPRSGPQSTSLPPRQ